MLSVFIQQMNEDDFQSIGFMFDRLHSRTEQSISFTNGIAINLTSIGNDPGHVQSGQYLWPAAKFACVHLIQLWEQLNSPYILELGSGCGLTGSGFQYSLHIIYY